MKKLFIGVLALTVLGACSMKVDNTPGIKAYKAGEYASALEILNKEFEGGENQAGYALGMMYMEANGVEQDLVRAENYLLAAAMEGDPRAIKGLRTLYETYPACENDAVLARMWSGLWGNKNIFYGTIEVNLLNSNLQASFAKIYAQPCGDRPAHPEVAKQWFAWALTPKTRTIYYYVPG